MAKPVYSIFIPPSKDEALHEILSGTIHKHHARIHGEIMSPLIRFLRMAKDVALQEEARRFTI